MRLQATALGRYAAGQRVGAPGRFRPHAGQVRCAHPRLAGGLDGRRSGGPGPGPGPGRGAGAGGCVHPAGVAGPCTNHRAKYVSQEQFARFLQHAAGRRPGDRRRRRAQSRRPGAVAGRAQACARHRGATACVRLAEARVRAPHHSGAMPRPCSTCARSGTARTRRCSPSRSAPPTSPCRLPGCRPFRGSPPSGTSPNPRSPRSSPRPGQRLPSPVPSGSPPGMPWAIERSPNAATVLRSCWRGGGAGPRRRSSCVSPGCTPPASPGSTSMVRTPAGAFLGVRKRVGRQVAVRSLFSRAGA
ncbi:MAG: hypothetical protein JWL99_5806 [Streptomyces oryziradicis]|nr:hypothetical protein [Actinacidiphila oryziradicis]